MTNPSNVAYNFLNFEKKIIFSHFNYPNIQLIYEKLTEYDHEQITSTRGDRGFPMRERGVLKWSGGSDIELISYKDCLRRFDDYTDVKINI